MARILTEALRGNVRREWVCRYGRCTMFDPRSLANRVIFEVMSVQEARMAAGCGAGAVLVIPQHAQRRMDDWVVRMADPERVRHIQEAVQVPVLGACRLGHQVEAEMLDALGVDAVNESGVCSTAGRAGGVEAPRLRCPLIVDTSDFAQALRRIGDGARGVVLRGLSGSGDIAGASALLDRFMGQLTTFLTDEGQRDIFCERERILPELAAEVVRLGRIPVPLIVAGGIATPADAALCRRAGADAIAVGAGVFTAPDPPLQGRALVEATAYPEDIERITRLSAGRGMEVSPPALDGPDPTAIPVRAPRGGRDTIPADAPATPPSA